MAPLSRSYKRRDALLGRVIIAADLHLIRDWLAQDLDVEPDLHVAGTAASSSEVLVLARRCAPNLLVIDRSMPDGLLAVRAVLAELPRVRVLAFGAQETEPEIAVCSDAGIHGFIPRDATRASLIESARRAIRGDSSVRHWSRSCSFGTSPLAPSR
jgi:DNA-binding NarL/FixJ family response regulator